MQNYQQTVSEKLPAILKKLSDSGMEVPDYVLTKTASFEGDEDLPYSAFANPEDRTFPIHTKSDAWISAAVASAAPPELIKNANTKDRIKRMITKGADFWNIRRNDLAQMDEILAPSLKKTASEDKSFEQYAEEALERMNSDTELSQREALANAILKKASEIGHELKPDTRLKLEQSACLGTCERDDAVEWLQDLQCRIPKKAKEASQIVETCLKDLQESDRHPDTDLLRKVAGLTELAVNSRPKGQLSDELPERRLFSITPCLLKFAREELVELPCGKIWRDDLRKRASEIAANLYALTGTLHTDASEVEKALTDMTPVMASKALQR